MLPNVCHKISWKNIHSSFDAIQYYLKADNMSTAQHFEHVVEVRKAEHIWIDHVAHE
jgi:hypothetical protein